MVEALWAVAVVEVALVAALFTSLVVHALWLARRRRTRGPVLDRARSHLRGLLDDDHALGEGSAGEEVVAAFTALRRRERIEVLGGLGGALLGAHRERVTELSSRVGLLDHARRCSRRRSWHRRLVGVRLYSLLGGGEDVVPDLLDDPHPEVRAQATLWAVRHPTPDVMSHLVRLLQDPAPRCRFAAKDALVRLGGGAADPVRAHLDPGADVALLVDLLDVATWVAAPDFLDDALALAGHADHRVQAGAARLLGSIGGGQAIAVLDRLLASPVATVRVASAGALGRLGHWPAGPALARALDDPEWEVRRAAALALGDLGAPGTVLLRRAAAAEPHDAPGDGRSGGPAGAAMARRVLQARSLAGPGAGRATGRGDRGRAGDRP